MLKVSMEAEERKRIGAAIRVLRNAAGMSREDLAGAAGISTVFVTKIEQGGRGPSPQTLTRIAEALQTSPQQIMASAALLAASAAEDPEQMQRRVLRAAAVGGTAAAALAVAPLLGSVGIGVIAGVLAARLRKGNDQQPGLSALSGPMPQDIDLQATREMIISWVAQMPDEELSRLLNAVSSEENDTLPPSQ